MSPGTPRALPPASATAASSSARRRPGRNGVLLANAGVGDFAGLAEATEAHVDRILAINVKGTLFTVQKALPLLVDGASVVLMGWIAGTLGTPAFSVYAASKAAIRSFARS